MKKILGLVFALSLIAAIPANAQILRFGIKAGTNLVGSPDDIKGIKTDGYTGFFAGVMAKATIPVLGLGVEGNVLYSQSGAEIGNKTLEKKSIEIPVFLRYDLALPIISKVAVPFIAVGPQFGFTLSDDDLISEVSKFKFKKSQLSLNLGLGAVLFKHVQAHINYNIALGKTSEYSTFTDGAWNVITKDKTNTWQLAVAWLF